MNRILASALPAALFAFVFYLIGMTTTYYFNNVFSQIARLIYILCVLGASTWAIVHFRRKHFFITFPEGVATGALTGLLLGICIALHTYVFRQHIHPTFNEESKVIYQYNLTEKYNSPRTDTTDGKKRWTPEQINKQMERTEFYFTTSAGMLIDFSSTLVIALFTSITVGFISRKVKEN